MTDLIVVGGGPVGLATALIAARSGMDLVVLEPRSGTIDKACGEGLMPAGIAALTRLGVDPAGAPLTGIRYLAGARAAEASFRDGPGRGVRRTTLHEALRHTVEAEGITVLPLSARNLQQGQDGVVVSTQVPGGPAGPEVQGRYVVAADGLHSPTRRSLGLDATTRGPRRYGLRRHYAIPPWTGHVEVHWGPDAEAYVTPVGPDLVGVALLTRRRAGFDSLLAQFGALRARLDGAAVTGPVLGAGPLRQRSTRRVAGRVLLVGDASGYVDALTGEGLSLGIAEATEAVSALAAGRPDDYELAWRRVTRRQALLTHTLVQLTRAGPGRRLIVPAAAALPGVFTGAVHQLAH